MRRISVPFLAVAAFTVMVGQATAQVSPKFTAYGKGCASAGAAPPTLVSAGPVVNRIFEVQVQNVQKSDLALIVIGLSDTIWRTHGVQLPLNLGSLGAPNCTMYASGECLEYCPTTATGTMLLRIQVPNDKRLIGMAVYMQIVTRDKGSNVVGVAVSAGYKAVFGG